MRGVAGMRRSADAVMSEVTMFEGLKAKFVVVKTTAESDDSVIAERVRRLQESAARRLPSVYVSDRERILKDRAYFDSVIEDRAPVERVRNSVGDRVRSRRLAVGLTQAKLGELTGIARPNIARIESGLHTPTLTTLLRVAGALGVSVATFVSDDEHRSDTVCA